MNAKLYLAFALTIVSLDLGAQANYDEIVSYLKGETGYLELCYVRFALVNLNRQFRGETVHEELESDLEKVRDAYEREARYVSNGNACYVYNQCSHSSRVDLKRQYGGAKFDDDKCFRYSKYARMCKMATKAKNVAKIEKWICQVKDEITVDFRDEIHLCRHEVRERAWLEAAKEFDTIVKYDDQQLEKAKQALADEISTATAEKDAYDAKVRAEAYEALRGVVTKNMSEYKRCMAHLEVKDAGMRAEAARRDQEAARVAEAAAKKNKKGLKRIFW